MAKLIKAKSKGIVMGLEDIAKVKEGFNEFASKPTSIIYVGIIALLLISEWKNPTDLMGIIYKIIVLIIAFIIVTIFNTKYFKHH